MSLSIGIGFSQNLDAEKAAKEAATQSIADLGQDHIDLNFIFSTIHYPPEKTLTALNRVLKSTRRIGCSTAGIIRSNGIAKQGIAVLSIASEELKFGTGAIQQINNFDAFNIGTHLAQETVRDLGPHPRHAFLFLMDDKMHHTSSLLKGMQQVFGNVFSVIGAGSSDDFHYEKTFQFFNQQSLSDAIVGLLIGGQVNIGVGARHGWRPLGKPRIIDEAEGNIIKKIDGKSAVHLYQEFFGSDARDIGEHRLGNMSILYPLGINIQGSTEYMLRNINSIEENGSLICQGDLPVGAEVHLMIGNKESCKTAAKEAAIEAYENIRGKDPKLVLILESMSRLKLLGRDAHSEVRAVQEVFGKEVPLLGMYSNGEVSPFQTIERFKKSHHLNESIVVVALA